MVSEQTRYINLPACHLPSTQIECKGLLGTQETVAQGAKGEQRPQM